MTKQFTTDDLVQVIQNQTQAIEAQHTKVIENIDVLRERVVDLEQKLEKRGGGGGDPYAGKSLGNLVAASEQFGAWKASGLRGSCRIQINAAALTTVNTPPAPDRQQQFVGKPQHRLRVRNLLAPGQTTSNLVQYTKQTGRTNAARPVSEGELKPESSIVFTLAEAPVRTIATWIPASRQVMDDQAQLASFIDQELRYMIADEEEQQVLYGDGNGENVLGIVPQATDFSAPFSVENPTRLDVLLQAIAQAQQSRIAATGVIINDLDWAEMQATKDGEGRYIGGGPFAAIGNSVWTVPVVATPAVDQGEFVVGGFTPGVQIIDRMVTEILMSEHDSDNFRRNMVTIRAEERVTLAVKIPEAVVYGEYGVVSD